VQAVRVSFCYNGIEKIRQFFPTCLKSESVRYRILPDIDVIVKTAQDVDHFLHVFFTQSCRIKETVVLYHPSDFRKRPSQIRDMVKHMICDHNIECSIVKRYLLRVYYFILNVIYSGRAGFRFIKYTGRQVGKNQPAQGRNIFRIAFPKPGVAAAQFKYFLTRLKFIFFKNPVSPACFICAV